MKFNAKTLLAIVELSPAYLGIEVRDNEIIVEGCGGGLTVTFDNPGFTSSMSYKLDVEKVEELKKLLILHLDTGCFRLEPDGIHVGNQVIELNPNAPRLVAKFHGQISRSRACDVRKLATGFIAATKALDPKEKYRHFWGDAAVTEDASIVMTDGHVIPIVRGCSVDSLSLDPMLILSGFALSTMRAIASLLKEESHTMGSIAAREDGSACIFSKQITYELPSLPLSEFPKYRVVVGLTDFTESILLDHAKAKDLLAMVKAYVKAGIESFLLEIEGMEVIMNPKLLSRSLSFVDVKKGQFLKIERTNERLGVIRLVNASGFREIYAMPCKE